MKITDLKTTLVSVPHIEPEFISTGMRKGVTQCLIEVETDAGITGLGESICRPNAQVIEAAVQSCKPLLVGADPNNIEGVVNNIRHLGNWHFFERVGNVAIGGIEMALWDIVGKACGKPVYELLGGMVRDRMPIFYYLFRFDLDEMERRAKKAVEDGWQLIYFKVGHDIHADIEAVEAVRGRSEARQGSESTPTRLGRRGPRFDSSNRSKSLTWNSWSSRHPLKTSMALLTSVARRTHPSGPTKPPGRCRTCSKSSRGMRRM